ncbi:MAG: 30S ribosomal protein S12 methylthiotransferase RimO [Sphingobacteriales bacterium]|nr:MAG: 30S ribosomal protein S12 methylthiotransferase RimO [Sphingobacteriales bacterium]
MRTKPLSKSKINLITLGCSKNIYDSEVLMGQLANNNMPFAHEQKVKKGDTVVINTCGFIDRAKQESIDTILEWSEAKRKGKIDKLIVMGCLSERYKDDLISELPEVDGFFGTRELPEVLKSLGADYKYELLGERQLTTPSHYAFFKIAEGCNRPCSFCAIPLMRGKHASTPIEELVNQARNLAKNGTKELILIAQELTYYGIDLYGKRRLDDLLRNLSDVEGIEWIRMQYAYPTQFPMEILDVMNERSNICNYLDMPLQHISDNVLKAMRRGITRRKTYELVDQIRQKSPDIALRTTLLLGHPGETEQDFEDVKNFVTDLKFDRLGVFQYSHEDNTHSGSLIDDIPAEVKEERQEIIMDLQRDISMQKNLQKIGKTFKVLIDRNESNHWVGRTEFDSPEVDNEVLIPATDNYLRIGDFYNVEITDAMEYDLFGKLK